ncbi:hypothetical protein CHS0354_029324 [Potamilus streckersoni]|uniref:Peroxisomal membrane protein 11B n=1 Tax=Potamilus streckersoni TaxID=2493646 RepID=A0AAE0T2H2_9BIVA|nr:hypothetical protein CHS0354_029324 [Potamilus streckersoni]
MDRDLVSQIIKFNAQTNGRERICRLLQYISRFLLGYLEGRHNAADILEKLKKLEYMFSMTRKLLRFGKSLDFLQGALKTIHLEDYVLRMTLTLSKINQAFYLLIDHFIWAHNVGVVKLNKQKWTDLSARFYIATLILNLVRDIYDIFCVICQEVKIYQARIKRSQYVNGDSNHSMVTQNQTKGKVVLRVFNENKPLFLDFIKNAADIPIPACTLGYLKLSQQTEGLLGVISSVIGVATVWNPLLKLVPS